MQTKLYFHGTHIYALKQLRKEGLLLEYGRPTFTVDFSHALGFATTGFTYIKGLIKRGKLEEVEKIKQDLLGKKVINSEDLRNEINWQIKAGEYFKKEPAYVCKFGVIGVFKDPKDYIRVGEDCHIVLNKKNKTIGGWPNRYRKEQLGYFSPQKEEKIILSNKWMMALFRINLKLFKKINEMVEKIKIGDVDEGYLTTIHEELETVLSDPKLQVIKPKIPLNKIVTTIISGMIRNNLLSELRKDALSLMSIQGWQIINEGDHPTPLYNLEEVKKSLKNISNIINEKFIPVIVKKEYLDIKKNNGLDISKIVPESQIIN